MANHIWRGEPHLAWASNQAGPPRAGQSGVIAWFSANFSGGNRGKIPFTSLRGRACPDTNKKINSGSKCFREPCGLDLPFWWHGPYDAEVPGFSGKMLEVNRGNILLMICQSSLIGRPA